MIRSKDPSGRDRQHEDGRVRDEQSGQREGEGDDQPGKGGSGICNKVNSISPPPKDETFPPLVGGLKDCSVTRPAIDFRNSDGEEEGQKTTLGQRDQRRNE
jgi:hypothetical protein